MGGACSVADVCSCFTDKNADELKFRWLCSSLFFLHLNAEELRAFASAFEVVFLEAGSIVFEHADVTNAMFVVGSGGVIIKSLRSPTSASIVAESRGGATPFPEAQGEPMREMQTRESKELGASQQPGPIRATASLPIDASGKAAGSTSLTRARSDSTRVDMHKPDMQRLDMAVVHSQRRSADLDSPFNARSSVRKHGRRYKHSSAERRSGGKDHSLHSLATGLRPSGTADEVHFETPSPSTGSAEPTSAAFAVRRRTNRSTGDSRKRDSVASSSSSVALTSMLNQQGTTISLVTSDNRNVVMRRGSDDMMPPRMGSSDSEPPHTPHHKPVHHRKSVSEIVTSRPFALLPLDLPPSPSTGDTPGVQRVASGEFLLDAHTGNSSARSRGHRHTMSVSKLLSDGSNAQQAFVRASTLRGDGVPKSAEPLQSPQPKPIQGMRRSSSYTRGMKLDTPPIFGGKPRGGQEPTRIGTFTSSRSPAASPTNSRSRSRRHSVATPQHKPSRWDNSGAHVQAGMTDSVKEVKRGPGTLFGHVGIFKGSNRKSKAVVAVDSWLLVCHAANLRAFCKEYEEAGKRIMEAIALAGDSLRALQTEVFLMQQCSLFSNVDDATIQFMAAAMSSRHLAEDDVLFLEGQSEQKDHSLYVVQSGEVEAIYHDMAGNRHSLARFGPGDFLGEISLVTGFPRSATVVATRPSLVLELKSSTFHRFLLVHRYSPVIDTLKSVMLVRVAEHFRRYRIPFWSAVPGEKYSLFSELGMVVEVAEGQPLFEVGDPATTFYMIFYGKVSLSVPARRASISHAEHSPPKLLHSVSRSGRRFTIANAKESVPLPSIQVDDLVVASDSVDAEVSLELSRAQAVRAPSDRVKASRHLHTLDVEPTNRRLEADTKTAGVVPEKRVLTRAQRRDAWHQRNVSGFFAGMDQLHASQNRFNPNSIREASALKASVNVPGSLGEEENKSQDSNSHRAGSPASVQSRAADGYVHVSKHDGDPADRKTPSEPSAPNRLCPPGQRLSVVPAVDSEDVEIRVLGPGDYVGEGGLLGKDVHVTNAVATTRCLVIALDSDGFQELRRQIPRALAAIEMEMEEQNMSMSAVLHTEEGRVAFEKYLGFEYATENIRFWVRGSEFEQKYEMHTMGVSEEEDSKLRADVESIYKQFISEEEQENTPINIDFKLQKEIVRRVKSGEVDRDIFAPAVAEIFRLMARDSYPRFKQSQLYLDYVKRYKEMATAAHAALRQSNETRDTRLSGGALMPNSSTHTLAAMVPPTLSVSKRGTMTNAPSNLWAKISSFGTDSTGRRSFANVVSSVLPSFVSDEKSSEQMNKKDSLNWKPQSPRPIRTGQEPVAVLPSSDSTVFNSSRRGTVLMSTRRVTHLLSAPEAPPKTQPLMMAEHMATTDDSRPDEVADPAPSPTKRAFSFQSYAKPPPADVATMTSSQSSQSSGFDSELMLSERARGGRSLTTRDSLEKPAMLPRPPAMPKATPPTRSKQDAALQHVETDPFGGALDPSSPSVARRKRKINAATLTVPVQTQEEPSVRQRRRSAGIMGSSDFSLDEARKVIFALQADPRTRIKPTSRQKQILPRQSSTASSDDQERAAVPDAMAHTSGELVPSSISAPMPPLPGTTSR